MKEEVNSIAKFRRVVSTSKQIKVKVNCRDQPHTDDVGDKTETETTTPGAARTETPRATLMRKGFAFALALSPTGRLSARTKRRHGTEWRSEVRGGQTVVGAECGDGSGDIHQGLLLRGGARVTFMFEMMWRTRRYVPPACFGSSF